MPWRLGLSSRARRAALAVLALVAALGVVVARLPTASALTIAGPVTGVSTWFSGLGGPYGGCGMPQEELETQNFIALNVFNTPGDYGSYTRPLPDELADKIGMWDNGHNCGRWVSVTIGDYCTGVNDGVQNEEFCREGEWIADEYNGATLNMIVADSCGDDNAWCRDDPYHIDLVRDSLNLFELDGVAVGDMDPEHWNNRHVTWEFIEAPDYTGDIQIGFLQGAQPYWPALSISRLPNGIHGVESYSNGSWQAATMDGDMGQAYVVQPTIEGGSDFQVRVIDAADALLNDGRVYSFSLPEACDPHCLPSYTEVEYATDLEPGAAPTGTTSATCSTDHNVVDSWPGGFQGEITVTAGETRLNGWTVTWELADGQSLKEAWGGTATTSGSTVTITSLSWNSVIQAGGSTTIGYVIDGEITSPSLTCSSP